MDKEFWHQRWESGETAWHVVGVNPCLSRNWDRLDLPSDSRVLVPLCGKTEDLAWLASRGHSVVGVELSQLGVESFFAEHGWEPEISDSGDLKLYRWNRVEIFCGDYFALDEGRLGRVDAIYDRGALVALPAPMREPYVRQLEALVPNSTSILLITLDYPQQQMEGPPFAVTEEAVRGIYAKTHEITLIESHDALADTPRFRDRGVTTMVERTYLLTPRDHHAR